MNERIKQLRKSLGLTQQEFADRIGSKRNTVAKYETNTNTPSEAVITLICREFNINETWLRTGEGNMLVEINPDDRYAMNLARLQRTDNETIIRWVDAIAETNPDALLEIEKFMKKILGIN